MDRKAECEVYVLIMGTICTRVEAMANDSKSKSPRTLYEYACTISYEFAEILFIITTSAQHFAGGSS